MTTPADVLAAAERRLSGWSDDQRSLTLASADAALRSQAGLQQAFAVTVIPEDGRKPWGAFCAVCVLLAHEAGDMALFWQAASDLITADTMQKRAAAPRGTDALGVLIMRYLGELPDILPSELWRELCERAESDVDDVLAGYENGRLYYCRKPGAEPVPISFNAFRHRVQELRKTGTTRNEPVLQARRPAGWWDAVPAIG